MAGSYTGVFVFGDSLVDAGNALKLARTYDYFPFTALPDGAPTSSTGYYKGRFTDGYTFADLISNKFIWTPTKSVFPFGYDDPYLGISFGFLSDPSGNNLNFAYGGAQIRQGSEAVPDLDDQTDAFRDAVDGDADPNALHMFTFGGNDVHQMVPKSGSWMDLATAQASMRGDAREFSEELRQVIEIGARHILVTGVPDVGIQPGYDGTANEVERRVAATQYGEMLDSLIRAEIDSLRAAFPTVEINYISFTGMQAAVFDQLEQLYPASALYPEHNSRVVFFDKLHPTAQLHALAAAHMLDAVSGSPAGDATRMASPDYAVRGSISVRGEVDSYSFTLTAGSRYTFEMLGISSGKLPGLASWQVLADPMLRVIGPDGTVIASNDDGGLGLDAVVQFTAARSGTYRLELSGSGAMTGSYTLQAANHTAKNDVYVMSSGATRLVEGPGDGFDQVRTNVSYTLAPKAFIETLTTTNIGGTAPINLTGNELAQSIVGNAGSNVLDGKGGNDSLAGSVGPDTFAFSTALGSRNIDVIRDFDPVSDLIRLEDAIFKGLPRGALAADAFRLGTAAQDADDRVIFDAAIGTLYFDPDGTGGLAAQPFATLLGTSVHVSAADFFVV